MQQQSPVVIPETALEWIVLHGVSSNVELARLSNVCRSWRTAVHETLLRQAVGDYDCHYKSKGEERDEERSQQRQQEQPPLLLLPSMLQSIMRKRRRGRGTKLTAMMMDDDNSKGQTINANTAITTAALATVESSSSKATRRTETFCAAWFHPDGIREKFLQLRQSRDEELFSIQQELHKTLMVTSSQHSIGGGSMSRSSSLGTTSEHRFAPNGEEILEGASEEEDDDSEGVSASRRSHHNRRRGRSGGRGGTTVSSSSPRSHHHRHRFANQNHHYHGLLGVNKNDDDRDESSTTVTDQWSGYMSPIDVLEPFGYAHAFVYDLLKSAADASHRSLQEVFGKEEPDSSDSNAEPTIAVRGAVVARPESYCFCADSLDARGKEMLKVMAAFSTTPRTGGEKEEDPMDGSIAQIRFQEFQDSLIRREQRRRALQREVLPRVLWSNPKKHTSVLVGRQQRCVQFLNASGSHAVCMMTPTFRCGPIREPVTILCVAIATEDGCFLSGLHHRFELGHLYPEDSLVETTEQSSICIATERWTAAPASPDSDDKSNHSNNSDKQDVRSRNNSHDIGSHSRHLSASEDSSDDASETDDDDNSSAPDCSCIFHGTTDKLNEMDAGTGADIYRGRFGPGSWHVYTAIVDGDQSQIRVDGIVESMHSATTRQPEDDHYQNDDSLINQPQHQQHSIATAMLDGLTLGSDHCFGVSLCCGQGSVGQGEGAMSEVAVFSGRFDTEDLECLENELMQRHGIPKQRQPDDGSQRENDLEKEAAALYLWPPHPDSFRSERAAEEIEAEIERGVPLRFMARNRLVAWHHIDPVTGQRMHVAKIGARNTGGSSSDW